jgi:hypothetical protein
MAQETFKGEGLAHRASVLFDMNFVGVCPKIREG